jgi:hypothetical protein
MPTILAAFDDPNEARKAVERLIESGFSHASVQMRSGNDGAIAPSSVDGAAPPSAAPNQGLFGALEDFVADLTGGDDRTVQATAHSEAVRRGSAVVAVDAKTDADAERAREVLGRLGAVTAAGSDGGTGVAGAGGHDAAPAASSDPGQFKEVTIDVREPGASDPSPR